MEERFPIILIVHGCQLYHQCGCHYGCGCLFWVWLFVIPVVVYYGCACLFQMFHNIPYYGFINILCLIVGINS